MAGKAERVVVTGMGIASPLGCDVEEFWQGLLAGRSGVGSLDGSIFSGLHTRIGGMVWGYDESRYFDIKEARRMSRSSRLGVVAAGQAIAEARLEQGPVDRAEVGVLIGSSIGGYSASDPSFRSFYTTGRLSPLTIPISMNAGPAANVSIKYSFQGPLLNVDAACSTAAHSIGYAFNMIRSGTLQVAVTGAADCPFSPAVVAAWATMRALSSREECPAEACRPFSADRDGLVLGEGAGVLVLESESHALGRGAPILAEIKGYGASADSYHLTQPNQDGPAKAMQRALSDAGLGVEAIDYINAHATGTQWNDANETRAIKQVFGERAYEIPVVGNKAALGHSIAGSGALELIGCICSLRDQVVPPTINYRVPDPECDLDYVTDGSRRLRLRNMMSNSFAFGGSNAVLIVGKYVNGAGNDHP
ncbi:MAG TPA: beta-ketoacyl-[acyl-carrier-protein] synthase family protein [Anaerolineales bacterium]|nr:beta-ketoacyl-[acyl-carrier-protein] synthase family protein [Anaerolineales bacterium]